MATTISEPAGGPADEPTKAPVQTSGDTSGDDDTGDYTHRQVLTILSGLLLGMFLAALDQSIVGTAIRTIADDLDGLSIQAWVTTAYLITSTITTPIYGKLGDLYGRKKLFLFAISLFIVGSVACTFASSMYMLAVTRALQGIGGGGLFTLVLAIIGDIVAPRERARYTGYFMAVFATSSVLGPVVGGLFAGQASILGVTGWRWVFLVNVPIGIAALFVVTKNLHLRAVTRRTNVRIDWWGAVFIAIATVPLLVVAEQGREWGWDSARAIVSYAVAVVGIVGFVLVERVMRDDALIPLRIFRLRAASVTIIASVLIGAGLFGAITVLPQYFQIVHGASPTQAGLYMLPMVIGMMTAGITVGQITGRTGAIRPFPIIGSGLAAVMMAVLSFITADTNVVLVMGGMLLLGLGIGQCMQPITIIVQNAVPPREIGVATASATFFRQTGGALGVAVFLSLLFSTVGSNISSAFKSDGPGILAAAKSGQIPTTGVDGEVIKGLQGQGSGGLVSSVQDDSSIITRMNAMVAHPFQSGFADSMGTVLLGGAAVMFVAFIVLNFLPKIELRATAGAASADAQAAPSESAAATPDLVGASTSAADASPAPQPVDPSEPHHRQPGPAHLPVGHGKHERDVPPDGTPRA